MKKGQVSTILAFQQCFWIYKAVSPIYIISFNSPNIPKAIATFYKCGRNWGHWVEGMWPWALQLRVGARLKPSLLVTGIPLCLQCRLWVPASLKCGSKRQADSFWATQAFCWAAPFWETLTMALWALSDDLTSHVPIATHKVFNLQSPLFSPPKTSQCLSALWPVPTHWNVGKPAKRQGLNAHPPPRPFLVVLGNSSFS